MFEILMNFVSNVFNYILSKIMQLFSWLLDQLPSFDFRTYWENLTLLISYASKANRFFPIVELCALVMLLITFVIAFIVIKFILKLIPTIG